MKRLDFLVQFTAVSCKGSRFRLFPELPYNPESRSYSSLVSAVFDFKKVWEGLLSGAFLLLGKEKK